MKLNKMETLVLEVLKIRPEYFISGKRELNACRSLERRGIVNVRETQYGFRVYLRAVKQ